jgi:hypothetical protein
VLLPGQEGGGPIARSTPTPIFAAIDERRRKRRCALGLPVRIQIDGVPFAHTVELRDVSSGGCFVRTDESAPAVLRDQEVAIGFILPSRQVALARGRVRREVPDEGFAVVFDETNQAFERFVLSLLEGDGEGD